MKGMTTILYHLQQTRLDSHKEEPDVEELVEIPLMKGHPSRNLKI